MSAEAMVAVMDWSQTIWGEKLILMLIANRANWPEALAEISEADLALDAGRSPRHLRRHLNRLEAMGELICHQRSGHKTLFEIPQLPGEPDRRESMQRRRDARKRSYDARLQRIRDERNQRYTPDELDEPDDVETPPAPPVGKKAVKAQAQRDWQNLKQSMKRRQQPQEPPQEAHQP